MISSFFPNLNMVDLPAKHPGNFTQYFQELDK